MATGQREAARCQCQELEQFLELELDGWGKPSFERRSAARARMVQRRLQAHADEAEELRRQLVLRTAAAAALWSGSAR